MTKLENGQLFCLYCDKELINKRWNQTSKYCSEACRLSHARGSKPRGKK